MTSLMPAAEYRSLVLDGIGPPQRSMVRLEAAYGCVLAAELTAPGDLPRFRSSAMDGYALRSADVVGASAENPVRLAVAGEVLMGLTPPTAVGPGEAVAVPTGGMLPDGADTVVPIEACRPENGALLVTAPSLPGRHVRPTGEDLRRGEVLASPGRRLEAADLGALAAAGLAEVEVFRRPVVAILSTGNELVPPEDRLGAGQIHESNSFMLRGLVEGAGAEPIYAGHVSDDPDSLLRALTSAAERADLLVCTGGVSAGRNDPVKRAFAAGDLVRCVQVAVQPGRPEAFGAWAGKPFFGLPGNPMAALVGFELFVRPALDKLAGLPPGPAYRQATSALGLEAAAESDRYIPAAVCREGQVLLATAGARRRSNQLARLAGAGCLVEVPAARSIEPGGPCRVLLLRPEPQ